MHKSLELSKNLFHHQYTFLSAVKFYNILAHFYTEDEFQLT